MLGLAEGCLSATVPYLHERKQFGQKIWDFQVIIGSSHVLQYVYQSHFITKLFAIPCCGTTVVMLSINTTLKT